MAGTALRTVMTWLARRPLVLPALLAAAVLIGLAAGEQAAEDSWLGLPRSLSLAWVPTAVVVLAAVIGLMTLALFGKRSSGEQPERRSLLQQLVGMVLFAAFIMLLFLLPRFSNGPSETEETTPPPTAEATTDPGSSATNAPVEPADGVVAVLVVLGALAVLLWFRRSLGATPALGAEDDGDDGAALEPAVARAAGHLLDDDNDPRTAVLLAYRRLEETLESLGLERAEAETPVEHLTRSLRTLSINDPARSGPLLDLAALYARARFSDQAITPEDRRRAGTALDQAHRGLSGTVS